MGSAPSGALLGLAAGLGVDPSTEGGSDAYQAGYTQGAILRYCTLGAFAGLVLAFLIRADSARARVGFGLGLAAILALGVVTAQEHAEEKGEGVAAGSGRAGSTAYRAPGSSFRAGYLSGCTKQVPREGIPPTKAREYCECIFDELSADRDERDFYLLVRRLERLKRSGGQNAPPGVVREYLACARRTGLG